jgi:hypothetical protein
MRQMAPLPILVIRREAVSNYGRDKNAAYPLTRYHQVVHVKAHLCA